MTDEFQAGEVIGGRYRVVGKLGGGGMANVYLAEDTTLGRRVAIKVLLKRFVEDAKFVERFRREAKAAAGLNHPNIISVYDWGQVGAQNYIVMEYVKGETLKELVRRRGRLTGSEAVTIGLALLDALSAAHAKGVVHRDIKSQNILIDEEGRAKVGDFGIAQAGDPSMTEAGSILGTAQYLAPEQARGERVDERSDLYSVGIVLYEMLTGTVPFKGDTAVTVALKHVNELPREPAELVPGMPFALNQIVLKALAKDPARRYANAGEFAADLRAALSGGPLRAATFDFAAERTQVVVPPAIPGEQATRVMAAGAAAGPARAGGARPPQKKPRSPWVYVVAALAVAAVALIVFFVARSVFGSSTAVPGVVGLQEVAATRQLTGKGFKVQISDDYSDSFDVGFVTRQEPRAGIKLRNGGIVRIFVSRGALTLRLPDFRGQTAAYVATWLADNDLKGEQKTGRSDAVAKGEVFKQDPSANAQVKRGATVTYWVSGGVPRVTVPDVTLMSAADAAAELNRVGLVVGTSNSQPSVDVPIGAVISQNPPAGDKVDKDTAVDLVISSGSPSSSPSPSGTPLPVPSVTTMNQGDAEALLLAAGFQVKVIPVADPQPAGTVVDQLPTAGDLAPKGSTVTIYVAQ